MRMLKIILAALLIMIGAWLALAPHNSSLAQGSTSCAADLSALVTVAAETCTGMDADTVCLGTDAVTLSPESDLALAGITTIEASAADPTNDSWGIAVLSPQMGLPDDAIRPDLYLYGDAKLTNLVDPNAESAPTISLENTAGYPVNLRSGGGTNFPTAGTLDDGVIVSSDGRNEAGDWYRILTTDGPLWVYRDLVGVVDGEIENLNILAADDVNQTFSAPFQDAILTTTDTESCSTGASGLLIQYSGETSTTMRINEVDVVFRDATMLIQAPIEDAMDITMIAGEAQVKANGVLVDAPTDSWIELILDGESHPLVHQSYSFVKVADAPLALLPEGMVCTTGLLPADDSAIMLYTGPGDGYSPLTEMDASLHYAVAGANVDDESTSWYMLDVAGYARAWVEQDQVVTVGLCDTLPEAPIPAINAGGSASSGSGFVPAGQSVWQTDPGLDNVGGTCTQQPVAMCAHLAAITPNADGSITWRGQDISPYTLYPAGDNTFAYNGRNALNDGNVNMVLTFVDGNTWVMTATSVYDNDPACTHTFNYTAARNW